MHYCCPADPEKEKDWKEQMLEETRDIQEAEIEEVCQLLKVLGNPIRLKIAFYLLKREHCVCELVYKLQEKQNLVSHHLSIMKKHNLVENYTTSSWKFYRLNPDFAHILNYLGKNREPETRKTDNPVSESCSPSGLKTECFESLHVSKP